MFRAPEHRDPGQLAIELGSAATALEAPASAAARLAASSGVPRTGVPAVHGNEPPPVPSSARHTTMVRSSPHAGSAMPEFPASSGNP